MAQSEHRTSETHFHVAQVDAPRLFSGLWHMLQPVVDPHTKQKIVFLPYAPRQMRLLCTEGISRVQEELCSLGLRDLSGVPGMSEVKGDF
jgi:hypothetical protein